MISAKYKKLFWCGSILYVVLSSIALAAPAVKTEPAKEAKAEPVKAEPAKDEKADPAEIFERAEKAMGLADVKEALGLLRQAADMNYTPAQVYFAEYLDYSEYDEDAVGWFMTAAYQGNAAGAFGLAKMYAVGEGVERSNEKALYWFRFSADRNHFSAVIMMKSTYEKGLLGQLADPEKAKFWADKLPELQKVDKRERERKLQLAKKESDEKKEKDKAVKAELIRKLEESRAAEDAAKDASDDGATKDKATGEKASGDAQGATK